MRIRDLFRGLTKELLDILFPPQCLICGKQGNKVLCSTCLDKVEPVAGPICRTCGKPRDKYFRGDICEDCSQETQPFTMARSAAIYCGVTKDMIHHLKFNGRKSSSLPLAGLLINFAKTSDIPLNAIDLVVPVPLSRQRMRQRGFNQSGLLVCLFAKAFGLEPGLDRLAKIRDTKPQFDLEREQRLVNETGAYEAKGVKALSVLLIDDIYTTGSTAREASKALKEAGAEAVYVLTLARAVEKGI